MRILKYQLVTYQDDDPEGYAVIIEFDVVDSLLDYRRKVRAKFPETNLAIVQRWEEK
jgi:hypothetical protein